MAENVPSGEVKSFSIKRRIAVAALAILMGLFLARPGASRLKSRITKAISRAVARPSDIGSVHLRFLPRPGFDLDNLVIYEDPAFGAEPMLRAPEVTAVVRLTSLLRGRLDISRLELTEPSLNLVRREDGRWNWESLLEHTAKTPLAPTAKSKTESRLGFPYIEASSGRINFKAGAEKKPYALQSADFALWQESENAWGVRLEAQPLRTDTNLSDTGEIRISGTWQRAGSLRETPLQFSVEWQRAQLGQLSKLASGSDQGWRGEVNVKAELSGTPASLQTTTQAELRDFHRYDISTSEGLDLAAHCEGRYRSVEGIMREIFCSAPVGSGMIALHGDAGGPGFHQLNLFLNIENLPVSLVAQLARRAKAGLPPDLVATGSVQGNFAVKENGTVRWGGEVEGRGQVANLRLQSASGKVEVTSVNIPFALKRDLDDGAVRMEYGPFPVALGRSPLAQARGWAEVSRYGMTVRGDCDVAHTLRVASLLGLPATGAKLEGTAQLDLQITGPWAENATSSIAGFSSPRIEGTAQLHNIRSSIAGINEPIEISSGRLRLLPDKVRVEDLSARAAGSAWTGWVEQPRGCGAPGACVAHFQLSAEEMQASSLPEWLGAEPRRRSWYQVLSPEEPAKPSLLKNLRASGKLKVERLRFRNLSAEHVSASVDFDRGKMKVRDLRADLLGGKHRGDWQVDLTAVPPAYVGSGTLAGISLEQVAMAMQDPWIAGTARGAYEIEASGGDSAAFWKSANGRIDFEVRDATLPHLSLTAGGGPLEIAQWQGGAAVREGKLEIERSELTSPAEVFEISGSASWERALNLTLIPEAQAKTGGGGERFYSLTGSIAEPQVTRTSSAETQARLKSEEGKTN